MFCAPARQGKPCGVLEPRLLHWGVGGNGLVAPRHPSSRCALSASWALLSKAATRKSRSRETPDVRLMRVQLRVQLWVQLQHCSAGEPGRAGGPAWGCPEQLLALSTVAGVTAFVFWPCWGGWARSGTSVLSSEPRTEERDYSGAGREFPFQPVCAPRVVPRGLWHAGGFAGSLPAARFLAGLDVAAPQLGTGSAACPVPRG